jgi:outer membrane protein OmpA-like peptidoglycan-associated protein/tetratricopeptide (TPR) repeat protein
MIKPIALSLFSILMVCLSLPSKAQDSCAPIESKKAQRIYEQAMGEFKKKNLGDAYTLCKRILEEEPGCAEAYLMMGMINFQRSVPNYEAAEKNLVKAIELCPGIHPYAYFYLGKIAYTDQKYPDAVRYLEYFMKDVDKIKTDSDYDWAEKALRYMKFSEQMTRNPVPFDPVPLRNICSSQDEYLPILSPDNEMALFTRVIKQPPNKNDLIPKERQVERFMYAERKGYAFDPGEEMPYPFNQSDNEGGASLTVNNKFLVYTRCRTVQGGNYYNCDLCYSEFRHGQWEEIKNLGKNVNLPDAWDSQPSITADGTAIYFVSDRKGGYGGYDIYKTVKDEKGKWGTPVNLGPTINTAGNEKSPFIHPDNHTLYFSSEGHMGMGGYDIFYSRMDEQGKWGKPKNIGYPINSIHDDVGFFVSTDGHYGYFASNKFQGIGGWDVFSFDLYPEARPEKVLLVKGELKIDDPAKQEELRPITEPIKAKIELKNVSTRKVTEIPVDSLTGEYAAVVLFKNDYIMTVKKEGFGYESKYIAQEDTTFKAPAKVDMIIKPIEVGQSYKLNDIYFATDSYELTAESRIVIDGFAEFLMENNTITISIEGHTDDVGNDEYNLTLSENRAKSVYEYLLTKGIEAGRLSYKGYGESKPVESNLTPLGRAKNRRTVFVITSK